MPVSKAAMADMDFLELFIVEADISAKAAKDPIGCRAAGFEGVEVAPPGSFDGAPLTVPPPAPPPPPPPPPPLPLHGRDDDEDDLAGE